MIDVEEGFGSSATSAPTAGSAVMPLAYYYGFPSPKDNAKLYNLLVSRLAGSVNKRLEQDEAGTVFPTLSVFIHKQHVIVPETNHTLSTRS
jgi:polyribonucleotide 5'-hydroxyl-kinase